MNADDIVLDNRFLTTKEIQLYDDTELFDEVRKVPAGTLLPYDRKLIRHNRRIAQAIEENGMYSYFQYSGATRQCEHCVVGERGLDVLDIHPDRLTGADITIAKKQFRDADRKLEKSEMITENGYTHLMLTDRADDKDTILHVTIRGNVFYDLRHLPRGTEFYILTDTNFSKAKSIVFADGTQAVLFHKEGMYKVVEDASAKFYKVISVLVAFTIFFGGIFVIAANTGYIVIIGIIMIPVTIFLTAILVAPVIWTIDFTKRFF